MDSLRGKRIFIVEDDPANMAVNAATLRRTGAIIFQDFWNNDIVPLVKAHLPIDVILLDLMLRHDMNGYDLFETLQADPDLAAIPVIAVSAADPGIEIPRAKAKGLAGFIGKPILPRIFAEQIATCIDGGHVWHAQHGYPGE
jgi:two-component system cell cycle response regulator DivK